MSVEGARAIFNKNLPGLDNVLTIIMIACMLFSAFAGVVELVDTGDLKSPG